MPASGWNPTALPPYLTVGGLLKSQRRNIALFRTQCAGYVASHAAHRQTDLFGPGCPYGHRYCIWEQCAGADIIDDAEHVLLSCPLHNADRLTMLLAVRIALASAGLTLDDVGSSTSITQLLLGSLPRTVASVLSDNERALRDILRASAEFIGNVFHTRWTYGHKFNHGK